MNVTQQHRGRQGSHRNAVNPTAGVTLKAVAALQDPTVATFTRAQVAFIVELAFLTGIRHGREHDFADLIATWDAKKTPRQTRAERIAWEMRRFEEVDEIRRERERDHPAPPIGTEQPTGVDDYGRLVPTGETPDPDGDWPEVAVPGSVALQVAA